MTPRRTSPLVLLVHTITFKQARSWVPLALFVLATRGFDGGPGTIVALVVAVTALSLATALVGWWRFSYADGPTSVVVTRGLLSRSVRTVPNDRIRGVEVEAPPLHRLFGLVRVRIDAAAGGGGRPGQEEELVVDGVRPAEGDRLRAHLLGARRSAAPDGSTADDAVPAPPPEEVVARLDHRWLLYAPLVGSYLAVPLAAVGALFRVLDELPEGWQPRVGRPGVPDGALVAGLLVAAVVVLAVGAVVGSALVNWRFRVVRRGGSLIASRGLLTRRHTELEIDRIRGCTVTDGVGMRLVRAARTTALVTGLGDAARRGQVLPLGPRPVAYALATRLVADPGPLAAHPPAARRRRLVRAVAPGAAVLVAGGVLTAVLGWWPVLAAGAALTALGVPLGLARYAALGHAAGPRSFAVRGGWLVRTHVLLERRAVVGWRVRQSAVQRWSGLASVEACVGAGTGGYTAVDMAAGEVAGFARAASGSWADALQR
ncbi:PH domain-containing protein [Modestobacter sp. NPDC049651]|uniref:PH domain-containing protein n=1 Tax=unclassified Modestobacter TaxID=2643866 RepID=UPI00340DB96F